MKTFGTHAFVNQVLLGLLVTIGFGGSVGLGTVWMRHQVSVVADNNAALEQEYERVRRQLADTDALVEAAMSSDILRAKNQSMELGLVEMSQARITNVPRGSADRLVARSARRAREREAAASGVGIQLPLDQSGGTALGSALATPSSAPVAAPFHTAAPLSTARSGHFQFALGQ